MSGFVMIFKGSSSGFPSRTALVGREIARSSQLLIAFGMSGWTCTRMSCMALQSELFCMLLIKSTTSYKEKNHFFKFCLYWLRAETKHFKKHESNSWKMFSVLSLVLETLLIPRLGKSQKSVCFNQIGLALPLTPKPQNKIQSKWTFVSNSWALIQREKNQTQLSQVLNTSIFWQNHTHILK